MVAVFRFNLWSVGVVSLDLGSADTVRDTLPALQAQLQAGGVDLVFCNEAEAAALGRASTGQAATPHAAGSAAARAAADAGVAWLLRHACVQVVCMTLGSAGAVTTRSDGDRFHTPAVPLAPSAALDTTGCGDAFAAGFLWALLHGAPLPICAATGAAAGAEAAAQTGAALSPDAVARLRAVAAAAGAGPAGPPAPAPPPPGLVDSLAAWLFAAPAAGDAPLAHPAHRVPTQAALVAGAPSTGQLWGGEEDIDYSQPEGGPLVQTFDGDGRRVYMRRTLSGKLKPLADPGAAPYADGALHRSLSSRVNASDARLFDSSASLASTASAAAVTAAGGDAASLLPACGAGPAAPPASFAGYVAYYLGLGWLSDWVDSKGLFAAPQEAPSRMRRSMSSRVMTAGRLRPGEED